jgi:hypothetical protein
MHEHSARLFDEMAERAETILQLAEERLAAKARRIDEALARQQRRRAAGLLN